METNMTTSTNFNVDNSATGIIERLLQEGKITAKEAMILLKEMSGQNNSYMPYIPTYPTSPIIYQTPSTTPYKWEITC